MPNKNIQVLWKMKFLMPRKLCSFPLNFRAPLKFSSSLLFESLLAPTFKINTKIFRSPLLNTEKNDTVRAPLASEKSTKIIYLISLYRTYQTWEQWKLWQKCLDFGSHILKKCYRKFYSETQSRLWTHGFWNCPILG